MTVSVRIPTILRTYTNGESEVSADGGTLAEVLESLDSSYPGIKGGSSTTRARSAGS
jgi:molybdopterin synthase sulfur carrier subunit